jgi:hypothetical protein
LQNVVAAKDDPKPANVPGPAATTLTKSNLEAHSASLSAAARDKNTTTNPSIVNIHVQGKRKAEEEEKEGPSPKKPKTTHLLKATPSTQSRKHPSVALQNLHTASVTASAAIASENRKFGPKNEPSSEKLKSSALEEIPENFDIKSTAEAVIAKARHIIKSTPVAGTKRKAEAIEDLETSAETKAKKQRLSGPSQLARSDNSKRRSSQKSPDVKNSPRALHNSANACYINAAMQLLYTIPELENMRVPGNADARYYSPYNENELWNIAEKRTIGKGVKKQLRLIRDLLEKPAVKQQL